MLVFGSGVFILCGRGPSASVALSGLERIFEEEAMSMFVVMATKVGDLFRWTGVLGVSTLIAVLSGVAAG